jgi:hypothetical protein
MAGKKKQNYVIHAKARPRLPARAGPGGCRNAPPDPEFLTG